MLSRYLNIDCYNIQRSNISFLIKLLAFKDIWIFNCAEGCQSNLISQGFKINNLSKIIVGDLHINNIAGLLGLLSSLNLIGRTKSLHIYGPRSLKYYLDLGKKYSCTNFSYIVYFHVIKTGVILSYHSSRVYALPMGSYYQFIVVHAEQHGTFCLNKARSNYLTPGPLYGKLKKGYSFILPDGFALNGFKLTSSNYLGNNLCFLNSNFYKRVLIESTYHSRVLLSF